jgi:hypothetical protein
MFNITGYEGYRFGITYLLGDARLTCEEKDDLLFEATRMYLEKEDESEVKGENFEGVIYTRRQHAQIGTYSGIQFDADIDTNDGKINLRFLVNELTDNLRKANMN